MGAFGDENDRGSVCVHAGWWDVVSGQAIAADGNGYVSDDFGHSLSMDGRTIVVGLIRMTMIKVRRMCSRMMVRRGKKQG